MKFWLKAEEKASFINVGEGLLKEGECGKECSEKTSMCRRSGMQSTWYTQEPERRAVSLGHVQSSRVKGGLADRIIVQKWALMPTLRDSCGASEYGRSTDLHHEVQDWNSEFSSGLCSQPIPSADRLPSHPSWWKIQTSLFQSLDMKHI